MPAIEKLLTPETLDYQPFPGLSVAFILIFYAPLLAVVLLFLVHCLLAQKSVVRKARVLCVAWLLACVPATLLILMGYAFNSAGKNIFLQIPLWIGTGLALIWLPVGIRKLLGKKPV